MSQLTPDPRSAPDPTTGAGGPQAAAPGAENSQTAPAAEGDTAPTQTSPGEGTGSTGSPDPSPAGGYGADGAPGGGTGGQQLAGQDDPGVISDDQLPEDLRPTDDNPLAQPPSDDEDRGTDLESGGAQL